MPKTYKQRLIEVLECRIKAQQPDIDALKRNPDNNRFVNYLEVVTERRKETEAVLVECIEREGDEIETAAALEAAFYDIIDRTAARVAMADGFHKPLETALIRFDIDHTK